MDYPHELMAEMLMMTGMAKEQATANAVALVLMAGMKAAGLVTEQAEVIVARDARVVELRGEKIHGEALTMAVISARTGLPRCELYRAIRRHLHRRRAVLRLIA